MIGYLEGKIKFKFTDHVVVVVNGVGYEVSVGSRTSSKLILDQDCCLHIHTYVRDDALELFGFVSASQLQLFRSLLTVSGVGPKTAMAVVDQGVEAVRTAIGKANVDFFTTIPRLGRKGAQKIIIELKNKLGGTIEPDLGEEDGGNEEILDALMAMGYSRQEAVKAASRIPEEVTELTDQVRFALKQVK